MYLTTVPKGGKRSRACGSANVGGFVYQYNYKLQSTEGDASFCSSFLYEVGKIFRSSQPLRIKKIPTNTTGSVLCGLNSGT